MMMKIAHMKDIDKANSYPPEILKVIRETLTILDNQYGEERDADKDLGGYVLLSECAQDHNELEKNNVYLDNITPEYKDFINCQDGREFISSLILLNNDFAVLLIQIVNSHK